MFIVIYKDEWEEISILLNNVGRPKKFENEDSAYQYSKLFELQPFQVIKLEI